MKTKFRNLFTSTLLVFVMMLAISLLTTFVPLSVKAASSETPSITVNNDSVYLYDDSGENTVGTVPGISYDEDTDVLTLDGYNDGLIELSYMYETEIKIVGDNTIHYDSSVRSLALSGYFCGLKLTGNGTLNFIDGNTEVNPDLSWYNDFGAINITGYSSIYIDGPTINIGSTVMNGISTTGSTVSNIEIKNSKINIENAGEKGIYTSGVVNIIDSEITCNAYQNGIMAKQIKLSGNTSVKLKTTNNASEAITLYATDRLALNTTGSTLLEKSDNGAFLSEQTIDYDSLDSIYEYNVTNETNKRTYTFNTISSKTLVDLVEIDGTDIVPVVEQAPKALTISSEKYEIVEQYWIDCYGYEITQFEKGIYYIFVAKIRPKNIYCFNASTQWKLSNFEDEDVDFNSDTGTIAASAIYYIPGDHQFISGANQTYVVGSNEQVTFEISGNKADLYGAYIGWEYLPPDYYSVTGDENTTIITLDQSLLDFYNQGEIELYVCLQYTDGQFALTTLTIINQQANDVNPCENGHTESEWKTDENNHWKECTVTECGAIIGSGKAVHIDDDGDNKCDTCNYEMPAHEPDNPITPSAQNPPTDDNDGLGTGAIIGIVVVAVVVIGGSGFAIFWFGIRKKRY